jgi:hypothetical protein
MPIDQDKLMDFLHKFVGDLGATMAAGNVVVGDRLGCTGRWPSIRCCPASSPGAPVPPRAT